MASKPDEMLLEKLATALALPPNFATMSGSEKLDALLSLPDPGKVLRRLRPDEFYYMLTNIGLEDCHDLLAYATPEQRQTVFDMETWSKDRFDAARFDRLLDMVREVSTDLALSVLRATDKEVLSLRLLDRCTVEVASEVEDPPDGSFLTPDNVFLVICEDLADVPALRRYLDLLYANGIEEAHLVIQAARRSTKSILEDEAFRFRDARLQDLGFASADERFDIYEPFDVEAVRARLASETLGREVSGEQGHPLALVLNHARTPPLFLGAMATLASRADIGAVVDRLLYAINRVMSARTENLHEDGAWEAAAAHTLSLASVGLEELAGQDVDKAAEVLRKTWPIELYRIGIESVRPLHLAARQVVSDLGGVARLNLLDEEAADTIRAALTFPPLRPDRSDFRCLAEVISARGTLFATAAVSRFAVKVLGFRPERPTSPGRTTFANVFATAWAWQVLAGEASLASLSGEDIRGLLVAAFEGGRLRPGAREAGVRMAELAIENHRPAVRAFIEKAIDAVEAALGGLDPGREVDTRFLGDVLLTKR